MSADRCNELIELHEKIVLQSGSELSENKNLPAHPDRRQGHGLGSIRPYLVAARKWYSEADAGPGAEAEAEAGAGFGGRC